MPLICVHSAFIDQTTIKKFNSIGVKYFLKKPLNNKQLDEIL